MNVSVVIATYNRQDMLRRLLVQLDAQTIDAAEYEAIAVDDGSKEDTRAALADVKTKYAHRIERQENAGAAAARQRGVDSRAARSSSSSTTTCRCAPISLEQHLTLHKNANTVVLGRLRPDAKLAEMPLFERF